MQREEREGRITKCVGGLYYIRYSDGSEISCKAKGAFRHDGQKPIAGDIVITRGDSSDKDGALIESIKPRKNALVRPPLANLDIIFVVMAAAKPAPILNTFDKLICLAEYLKIEPVVIITKADEDGEKADELLDIYKKSGFKVFKTDIGKSSGKDELKAFIASEAKDKLSCFAGASGVGKSTLMTALFPELDLQTGEISRKIARGKQTTRHVELYPLCDLQITEQTDQNDKTDKTDQADQKDQTDQNRQTGFIADTPGFSLLDFVRLDFFTKEDLPYCFREFDKYIGSCKYTKCTHLCEEGCAIVEAVKRGDIPKQRHESFVEIYNELKNKHEWDKKAK